MLDYRESTDGVTAAQLEGFFEGWPNPPDAAAHLRLLRGSGHVVLAVDSESGDVVGFVTALTDGVISAYLPLLEVRREHRGQGIGSELVRRVLARLEGLYMVDVTCDPDVQPFYRALGLVRAAEIVFRSPPRSASTAPHGPGRARLIDWPFRTRT